MTGAVAIVLAAGSGERLGKGEPKALVQLAEGGGQTMLSMAVAAASGCADIERLVVTVPPNYEDRLGDVDSDGKPVVVVPGGSSRQASVEAGLQTIAQDAEFVVCHDAARPFASSGLFARVLGALSEGADGAVPVLGVPDTVKRVDAESGAVVETVPRQELRLAQTPQAFRAEPLREAHRRAAAEGREFTDDAAMLEWAGYKVRAVEGEAGNFKITTAEDLARAAEALSRG